METRTFKGKLIGKFIYQENAYKAVIILEISGHGKPHVKDPMRLRFYYEGDRRLRGSRMEDIALSRLDDEVSVEAEIDDFGWPKTYEILSFCNHTLG